MNPNYLVIDYYVLNILIIVLGYIIMKQLNDFFPDTIYNYYRRLIK